MPDYVEQLTYFRKVHSFLIMDNLKGQYSTNVK